MMKTGSKKISTKGDDAFNEWRDSLPENHWAKSDISSARAGWDAAIELIKPSLPWRKVSEEPEAGREVCAWTGARVSFPFKWEKGDLFHSSETHWCYLDELNPEDTGQGRRAGNETN